jgi:hypothetical protein
MRVEFPLRTGRGQNDREHWRARTRRVRGEKDAAMWALLPSEPPSPPCVVTLTRIAPSNGLDDDNLAGSLKAVRDAFAAWIGVDDKKRDIVRYEYRQERGPWAVRIEAQPRT